MGINHASAFRLVALLALVLLGGCRAIGPPTIPRDRFDYSRTIADSWKQQTLLNIIKVRYLDVPIFLDVASVVSGYQFETAANIGGTLSTEKAVQGDYLALGAQGRYIDRPTITYSPKTGDKFLESLLKPIAPGRIFFMLQAGYAADFLLELSLDSLCGLRNRHAMIGSKRRVDPQFLEALQLLREVQDGDGLRLRVELAEQGKAYDTVIVFHRQDMDPDLMAKAARLKELLGLPPARDKFRLVFSPLRGEADELTVASRSMIQIMMALSCGVDIPADHQKRLLTPLLSAEEDSTGNLLHIRSGPDRPEGAFAAVQYEGAWFWIAASDWKSKRTFAAMMFLFTMLESGAAEQLPVLTIPTH